ncbi:MAG TPA: PAS domain S-box protein [Candidatus Hydrogenedentes bacterium]|nr:PAS domain S-box protein [Candidatus Hydrogenedentota bacterium]
MKKTKAQLIAELERLESCLAGLESASSNQEAFQPSLHISDEFCRCMADGSPIPAFVISTDHTIVFWNQALAELSRLPATTMIGSREQWRAFYDKERPCMADLLIDGDHDAIQKWYAGKGSKSELVADAYEATDFFPALGDNGRWLRFTAALLRDVTGTVLGAIETLEDVTDRRRAEDGLRLRDSLNQQLLSISDFRQKLNIITTMIVESFGADFARIWLTGDGDLCAQGCIHASVTEGPHVCRDRSRCLHLMVSTGRYTHIDGSHQRVPLGCYKIGRVASGDEPKFLTNDVTHDPRIHDHDWARALGLVSFIGYRIRSGEGAPLGVLALFSRRAISSEEETLLQDIANIASHVIQAGLAEEALQKSEEKYRGLIETTDTGYVILDQQGNVLDANPKYVSLAGFESLEEIRNRNVLEWTADHIKPQNFEAIKQCMEQGFIRNLEIEYVHTDGTHVPIEVNATVVKTYTGTTILSLCRDITERKQAEEALRKSGQRFRAMIEYGNDVIVVVNQEGVLCYESPSVERLLGYGANELFGMNAFDFIHPDDLAGTLSAFLEVLQEPGRVRRAEYRFRHKNGSWRVHEGIGCNLLDEPAIKGVVINSRDITERKQTEESLLRSEERFQQVAENAQEWIWEVDTDGLYTYVSPTVERILGHRPEEIVGKMHFYDLFHPENREEMKSAALRVFAEKQSFREFPNRNVHRDGREVWLLTSGIPMLDEAGNLAGYRGVDADITERKRAEESLRHMLDLQSAILNNAAYMLISTDNEGVITTFNPAAERALGYTSEECIGKLTPIVLHDPDEVAERARTFSAELGVTIDPGFEVFVAKARRKLPNEYEWTYIRKDGLRFPVLLSVTALCDPQGNITGFLGMASDITERKQAEEIKHHSERRTAIMNEIAQVFLTVPDAEMYGEILSILIRVTNSPYGIFGFIEENGDLVIPSLTKGIWQECQVSGKSFVFPPDTWGDSLWGRAIRERRTFCSDGPFHTPPGHLAINTFLAMPVTFGEQAIGLLALANRSGGYAEEQKRFLEDIAKYISPILHARLARDQQERGRRIAEEQLRQSQKMESVGRLAGGVAHDFNNLLTAILGYVELSMSKIQDLEPEVSEWLTEVQRSAERARDLTWQLLAFGRKQALHMRTLDLNELILGLMKMLTRLIGEDIHVVTNLEPVPGTIRGDQSQLEQVLLNLAINARDAMPQGGRLTIETSNVLLDKAYAATHMDVHPGAYVMMAVSDNGCGMDAGTLAKIFEPFFTTKEVGKGTGLGLATVYGIVKQHNGHVSVYSEVGHGTTFKVYLPRIVTTEEGDPASLPAESATRGVETILLVEDDAAVRKLAAGMLSSLGYHVIEAQDGPDAVQIAARHETIHLLLTDVIMPGMSGQQVFDTVALTHPGIKVLYMSGYPANIIAHQGALKEGVRLLQKPFTLQNLAAKIREALIN